MGEPPLVIATEPATGATAAALVRAAGAEIDARYGGLPGSGPRPAADMLPPAGAFLVARRGGEPVGGGGFRRLEDGVGEAKSMYVVPAARRGGVARALLVALEQAAAAAGYGTVRLETGCRQEEALALLRREGYRAIAPSGPYRADPRSVCFEKAVSHRR